ncbi:hypothetical protein ASPFODRAFT_215242 [Aspergillus luchuensis CBS 106.47]|uniref:Uncharacterized protein n=1 Tax=Aspergillus luchuensis (strain CBS 106.47) TaxID=1137211 RepID=A0A1M3TVX2_ASPLC|nr:hypothetical protein ASPFODRAFT_215242 [Aspergillus luchuensis CBS 106.47]
MAGSIQNIVATPLHAVAESNIALAHVNFDFSLVKVEAPAELQPVGRQLSQARRQSAEDGSFHILARRLGVLFDDVLPDVPLLLEAYGTRASEIAQETSQKLHQPRNIVDGFFGTHLGIDSTTIWASATSGRSLNPSEYVIRFRTRHNSWAFSPILHNHPVGVHGGMKRKRDEYEASDADIIECVEIPPGEDWICIATPATSREHAVPTNAPVAFEDIFAELMEDNPQTRESVLFDFVFGDHNLAAVYRRRTIQSPPSNKPLPNTVPLSMVQDLLDKNALMPEKVAEYILDRFGSTQALHENSLLALGRVIDYYKYYLPQATVSMSVIKSPMTSWKWVPSLLHPLDLSASLATQQAREGSIPSSVYLSLLSREHAFAAILQFESGTISLDTPDLEAVFAISSGNSLFIAKQLLYDPTPADRIAPYAVSHAIGNVGKPGIALLVSPPELEIREHTLERWRLVNHHPFDGNPVGGRFDGTSLHLSFTGWDGPVSLDSTSYRTMEAYYLQTTISVNDGGEWVGDVDILKGLTDLPDSPIKIGQNGVYRLLGGDFGSP